MCGPQHANNMNNEKQNCKKLIKLHRNHKNNITIKITEKQMYINKWANVIFSKRKYSKHLQTNIKHSLKQLLLKPMSMKNTLT